MKQLRLKNERTRFGLLVLGLLLLICVSRALTLTHEMEHHPDESVFFTSSVSLKEHLLNPDVPFTEVKEYPEGAYVFQMPFHLLSDGVARLTGRAQSARLWGRIASVFYFAAGCVPGCAVLRRFWHCRLRGILVYALIMGFGLLHIEQSRYGTGEAISFFLLMLIVYATLVAIRSQRSTPFFCLACFAAGAMGAVKYPQLYFALCPIGAFWLQAREQKPRALRLIGRLTCLLVCLAAGLMLFSPKALADPAYFLRVCQTEMVAYVHRGNLAEIGGKKNHLALVLIYHTLYSDLPFALPLLAVALGRSLLHKRSAASLEETFSLRWLPLLTVVFMGYNLLTTTVFLRTLYPYFCLCSLYAARLADRWMTDFKAARPVCLLLCTLMVARGTLLMVALGDDRAGARLASKLADSGCETTFMMGPGYYTQGVLDSLPGEKRSLLAEDAESGELVLQPSQALISASLSHGRAGRYIFPIQNDLVERRIENWERFRAQNSAFFLGGVP